MKILDNAATSWARALSPSAGYTPPTGITRAALVWGMIAMIYGAFATAAAFAASAP